jgi:hypothetical protein
VVHAPRLQRTDTGLRALTMSEISPCDERDPAFPSQDDVESVLSSLALIQKNAGVASKYIRTGEYDHRNLRQAINDIREGVQNLVEKFATRPGHLVDPDLSRT